MSARSAVGPESRDGAEHGAVPYRRRHTRLGGQAGRPTHHRRPRWTAGDYLAAAGIAAPVVLPLAYLAYRLIEWALAQP